MSLRSIEAIFNPPPHHWVGDGFKVNNFIPSVIPMQRISPFVMLDYGAKTYFAPTTEAKGVGSHPHRGFETVTIAYKGSVAHHDSKGNSGIIGEGEVQWMTAGSGILHKEYHEQEFAKLGGDFQMVQLWVNLPAKDKMTEPKYQALTKDKIIKVELPNNSGVAEIIAGDFLGKTGPAFTFSPVTLVSLKLNSEANCDFELPKEHNCAILVLEGGVEINGKNVIENQMVLFQNDAEKIEIKTVSETILLVISGEPLNEPIFSYGPFLMNTKEQIIQAFEDFEAGKFGQLD
jgi:redox-sensitive bicupin YhaK (pirin superfamily)